MSIVQNFAGQTVLIATDRKDSLFRQMSPYHMSWIQNIILSFINHFSYRYSSPISSSSSRSSSSVNIVPGTSCGFSFAMRAGGGFKRSAQKETEVIKIVTCEIGQKLKNLPANFHFLIVLSKLVVRIHGSMRFLPSSPADFRIHN